MLSSVFRYPLFLKWNFSLLFLRKLISIPVKGVNWRKIKRNNFFFNFLCLPSTTEFLWKSRKVFTTFKLSLSLVVASCTPAINQKYSQYIPNQIFRKNFAVLFISPVEPSSTTQEEKNRKFIRKNHNTFSSQIAYIHHGDDVYRYIIFADLR